ncbi:thiamine pyrophosphate-binding protein [Streptomyces sp. NBC_00121]|uniref:thiamine pyrophosphate-dependent enzyme n=1 Tax=unclassified Streptomyces TaxID=2593676 RepID=UPI0028C4162A|nr:MULTISPECIES: thiamine pyrophosphate-dependent enzyme [unclassified Streptomyces]WNO62660.1 thiamine pyrophosphate-binding protein [Streptomyces sp. AM2-3-1]WSC67243.1 thiamine pyrophosphate-binding protein [Streptomyces sp. NBC_01760]WTE57613.1 thiamine pyrophosphate-binding protein [Streptomyces sp. NBC_01617]WTI85126.1 thiamine pyrophosphate-binding protein [Streptomyces sp. NBC_00724]
MTRTVARLIGDALSELGVRQVFGVVGDALNPLTEAIRTTEDVEWVGCRHEETAAFAASAQSQLSGNLGVCMGTVGPGSIHLLNGLYDAAKSRTPVLAIAGQVPLTDMGSDYFQEVDNDALFSDVAVFRATISSPDQLPQLLETAVRNALGRKGVAVLTVPGDISDRQLSTDRKARFSLSPGVTRPEESAVQSAADLLRRAERVTLLVGQGARAAREDVLALADRLAAPMVLTLKAKEGFEGDNNPFQVGQTGLIGNPAAASAMQEADTLLLLGTDFPYREWYPEGRTVIQVDTEPTHIGRRVPVEAGLVGDVGATVRDLLRCLGSGEARDRKHLDHARERFESWRDGQARLADPKHDKGAVGRLRTALDNPEHGIRPEALAATVDRVAADNAVFTSDTGMATVWLSRFVEMRGARRLLGSYNLGSMANAMPHALGAQYLDRQRQVIAFCGDGGLSMLLGDLMTLKTSNLPVKLVVFDNRRLGMVKLEQEQAGLPEYGTLLDNPDFAAVATAMGITGIRVTDPADLEESVRRAFSTPGPVLLDVLTNPDEIAIPAKPTVGQGWGFAVAKVKEVVRSHREPDSH